MSYRNSHIGESLPQIVIWRKPIAISSRKSISNTACTVPSLFYVNLMEVDVGLYHF